MLRVYAYSTDPDNHPDEKLDWQNPILVEVMEELGIAELVTTQGALREGIMYDLAGRLGDEDGDVLGQVRHLVNLHCPFQPLRIRISGGAGQVLQPDLRRPLLRRLPLRPELLRPPQELLHHLIAGQHLIVPGRLIKLQQ